MDQFSRQIAIYLTSLILKKCGIHLSENEKPPSQNESEYENMFPTLSDIKSVKTTINATREYYNSPTQIMENENKIKLIERQLLHALNEIQSKKLPFSNIDEFKKQIVQIYENEITNLSNEEIAKIGDIACFQTYKAEVLINGAFRKQRLELALKVYVENKFSVEKVQAKDLKFYQNTNLDCISSIFTSTIKQLERMRKDYAAKFGTNLIVYSYSKKQLKSQTLSIERVIDSLYTTTSRRADGGEGLYGGLVETIRFNIAVFYDLAHEIANSIMNVDENLLDAKLDEIIGKNAQNLSSGNLGNILKTNKLVKDYDKEVWDTLLTFTSESESVVKFMKIYAKDRYYRIKGRSADSKKADIYKSKLKSIHDELGFFDSININLTTGDINKLDIVLKEELFGPNISDHTMQKIILTCLNACYRELIEETTESTGKKTEASVAYEKYLKNFSQNIMNNGINRIVAAGFAKDKNNQWVYTTEYKVPFEIGRTGFPFGFRNFPALTHPVMLTTPAIINKSVTNDYLEMIRAYDRSWARATVGAIIGVFDLILKDKTNQNNNFNTMNTKLMEYYKIEVQPQELNQICTGTIRPIKLYNAVLVYKIQQRMQEELFDEVWTEDELRKAQTFDDPYFESEILNSKARKDNSILTEKQNLTEEITKRLKPQSKIGIGANGNIAEQGDLTPRSFIDIISLYGVQNINYVDKDGKPIKIPHNVDVLDLNRTTSDIASLRHKNLTMTYGINYFGGFISGLASTFDVWKQLTTFTKDDYRDFIKFALAKGQQKVFQKEGAHLVSLVAIAAEFEQYNDEEMNYGRLCEYVANQLNNALLIAGVYSNETRLTSEDVADIDTFIVGKYIDCLENYNLINKGQIEIVKYSNCGLCSLKNPIEYKVALAQHFTRAFYEQFFSGKLYTRV